MLEVPLPAPVMSIFCSFFHPIGYQLLTSLLLSANKNYQVFLTQNTPMFDFKLSQASIPSNAQSCLPPTGEQKG